MEKLEINTLEELSALAKKVLAQLSRTAPKDAASVLALSGDLGAGKTAFVKELANLLKIEQEVTSPTFVILKLYPILENEDALLPFDQLAHIDAYRVEDIDEMRVLRFSELLEQKRTLVCIEWAEKIESLLPPHTVRLHLALKGQSREVTLS